MAIAGTDEPQLVGSKTSSPDKLDPIDPSPRRRSGARRSPTCIHPVLLMLLITASAPGGGAAGGGP
jgi:hypothetical protein